MTCPFLLFDNFIQCKKYLIILCLTFILIPLHADILYVDKNASGANNGVSWTNAYTVLRTAYDAAQAGDELWVKRGTYTLSSTGDKTTFITLKKDVGLYGGFSGDESKRQERRWWEYETILSGDLNGNDNSTITSSESTRSENSHKCFYGTSTNINTIIDGFTIQSFNAEYTDISYTNYGAGIYLKNTAITVRNCHFTKNCASSGAAIYTSSADPRIINCIFDKNHSFNRGYVLYFYSGITYMSHCVVYNNYFPSNMSPQIAVNVYYAERHMTNNIIYNNVGDGLAHAEHDYSDPLNIIYNIIENTVEGTGNLTSNPTFRNTTDFTLKSVSPAIDSGTDDIRIYDIDDADCDGNTTETYPLDYYGFQRDDQPDRGCREYNATRILVNGITSYPGILTSPPSISWMFDELLIGNQLKYQVQVSTDSTFSSIDMWNSGLVTSEADSITYEGNDFQIATKYYIRLNLTGDNSNSDWINSYFTTNSLPAVTLVSPAESETVNSTYVTFKAVHEADPEGDDLEFILGLYNDAAHSSLITLEEMTPFSADSMSVSITIPESEQNFYWLIITSDHKNISTSNVNMFKYRSKSITSIDIIDSGDDDHIVDHTPEFTWLFGSPFNEQISYTIQVSTDSTFSSINMWDPGYITSSNQRSIYNGNPLANGTRYYARIKSNGSLGTCDWFEYSFQMNSVPTPELLSPIDDVVITDASPVLHFSAANDAQGDDLEYSYSVKRLLGESWIVVSEHDFADLSENEIEITYPENAMDDNQYYSWEVVLKDNLESGSVASGTFYYNNTQQAPVAFTASAPKNHAMLNSSSVMLSWSESLDPDPCDTCSYTLTLKYLDPSSNEPCIKIFETGQNNFLSIATGIPYGQRSDFVLEDHVSYFWNVTATDLTGLTETMLETYLDFTINRENDKPDDFALLLPKTNTILNTQRPTFTWEEAVDPDPATVLDSTSIFCGYFVTCFTNRHDIGNYRNYISFTNSYTIPDSLEGLMEDSTYYWLVGAVDFGWAFSVSDTFSFSINTVNSAPDSFSVFYPVPNTQVSIQDPVFSWGDATDCDPGDEVTYTLYLGSDVKDLTVYDCGSATSFEVSDDLSDDTEYFWKVVATDQSGAVRECTESLTSFAVNTESTAPEGFCITFPENMTEVHTRQPILSWEEAFDSDPATRVIQNYRVKICDEPTFEYHGYLDTRNTYVKFPFELLDDISIYITVEAVDNDSMVTCSDTVLFTVNMENDIPDSLDYLSPNNLSTVESLTPTFSWTKAVDHDYFDTLTYSLSFGPDVDHLTVIENCDSLHYTPRTDLLDNTEYIWRVEVKDLEGATLTGDFRHFSVNTQNDAPGDFALVSPADETELNSLSPLFYWERSLDIDPKNRLLKHYKLILAQDAVFTDTSVYVTQDNFLKMDNNLEEDKLYFWTVQAFDGEITTCSDTNNFVTNIENDIPHDLTLITPMYTTIYELRPIFSWTSAIDSDILDTLTYTLSFGKDIENLTIISPCDSGYYVPSTDLMDNCDYIWNVAVTDNRGAVCSSHFKTFEINTQNDSPAVFSQILPDNEGICSDSLLTLTWDLSFDLDGDSISYAVYLNNQNDPETALDTVSVNYYRTKLADAADYRWKIVAYDENGASTETPLWSFDVNSQNSAPAVFALASPTESVCDTLQPTFCWHPSADVDPRDKITYTVIMGNSPENVTPVYAGTDTSFTPGLPMQDNSILYWSVSASDKAGAITLCSESMSWIAINTENDAPGNVELVSPDSSVAMSRSVNFIWSQATDPDPLDKISYTLLLNDGRTSWDSCLIDKNSATLDTLQENASYTWAVITSDLAESMSYSDTAIFWTDFTPEAPADFATISPANGFQQDELTVDLNWETAQDPDPFDKVSYSVVFAQDSSDSSTYFTVNDLESTQLQQNFTSADTYLWRVTAQDEDGFRINSDNNTWMSVTVGEVFVAESDLPGTFALHANYPNPFNPTTSIKYDVAEDAHVRLAVYNSRGQAIHSLINENMSAGTYRAVWNADYISSGIYFIVMDAGEFHAVRKCLFVK